MPRRGRPNTHHAHRLAAADAAVQVNAARVAVLGAGTEQPAQHARFAAHAARVVALQLVVEPCEMGQRLLLPAVPFEQAGAVQAVVLLPRLKVPHFVQLQRPDGAAPGRSRAHSSWCGPHGLHRQLRCAREQ